MRLLPLFLFMLSAATVHAALTVDPGLVRVTAGTASVQIPVMVTGGDLVTDMAGVVEAGTPPSAGVSITAVSYAGSIWASAAGGYTSFYTISPPAATIGPNVSLNTAGQRVAGSGVLMTITVNTAALSPGDYPVRLSGTSTGSTVLVNGPNVVPVTFVAGIIRVSVDPLAQWRLANFPGSAPNPATESTVWGDDADPDRDGLKNLMEYYAGTNPNVFQLASATPAAAGVPAVGTVVVSGQRYPSLTYSRRISAGSGINGIPEISTSLTGWSSAGFVDHGSAVPIPGGELELITKLYTVPESSANRRFFFRLTVSRQ